MPARLNPDFIDNPALEGREKDYIAIEVRADRVFESWKRSLFAYEWLKDGQIRSLPELSEKERIKRMDVERRLLSGETLEKPVLGIGVLDNVEIGVGRAIFLTLLDHGLTVIPVHIPCGHIEEFAPYLS